ncbi:MAG: acyl-CoA synthetase [Sphingomonadaceae bacterium]
MTRLATHGLRRAARTRGRSLAVSDRRRRQSWAETEARVARLATALRAHGARPGDRVAVLSDNSADYFELYWGAPWAGLLLAHLNVRWAVPEIAAALADCEARLLLHDASHAEAARAAAVLCRHRIELIDLDAAGPESWQSRVADADPMADAGLAEGAPVALFYTSGTTGQPKGATLTAGNIFSAGLMIARPFDLGPEAVALCVMPMFHVGAGTFLFGLTFAAASIHIEPRFDAARTLELIERERISHSVLVPTMIAQLLEQPDVAGRNLASMRRLIYGAAPMPDALMARAIAAMPAVGFNQGYSMTETTATGTCLLPADHADPARRRSVGQALPGNDIEIRSADGRPCPDGTVGEICIRGPGVMAGYWNRPAETEAVLRDGWLRTGDAGFVDPDGYVHVVDRLKDMIISGGENVYSAEVENVLHDHASVAECAVVGLPHARWGEQVVAVVHLRPGTHADAAALESHCRARLGGYKVPRRFVFEAEPLPKGGSGKILKPDIRRRLLDADGSAPA